MNEIPVTNEQKKLQSRKKEACFYLRYLSTRRQLISIDFLFILLIVIVVVLTIIMTMNKITYQKLPVSQHLKYNNVCKAFSLLLRLLQLLMV